MAFPESVKLDAKRRANYRCVVCQRPWVEVHHIQPEAQGGPDTVENAAPVCAGCHHQYGGNPELRKQLREMRDHWWERCAAAQHVTVDAGFAEKVDDLQIAVLHGQKRNDEVLAEVKALLLQQVERVEQQIVTSTSLSGMFSAASELASGLPDPAPLRPNPSYTGVVEAPIDGRVWRARLHAGKVIEVKPYCPRHGVTLKHQGFDNWHCTQGACDYYLYLPMLRGGSGDGVRFLTNIHTEVETRVREGKDYILCPNDPSSQI